MNAITQEDEQLDESARQLSGKAGCPECGGGAGEVVNVGRTHYAYCAEHKVKWVLGSNLFSSWRSETEDEQRARYDAIGLGGFREHLDEQQRAWASGGVDAGEPF